MNEDRKMLGYILLAQVILNKNLSLKLKDGKPFLFDRSKRGGYVPCANCGKLVWKTPSILERNKLFFCSVKCRKKYYAKRR